MTEPKTVELEAAAFRQKYAKPLANPRVLRWGIAVFGVGAVLSAFAAWQLGGFWAALMPIPCALMAGVCWAGLDPGRWFKEDRT